MKEVTNVTDPEGGEGRGGGGGVGGGCYCEYSALGGQPPCPCHAHTATRKRYLLKQELLQLAPLAFVITFLGSSSFLGKPTPQKSLKVKH